MNDDTTIIIITHDYFLIANTLMLLYNYVQNHHNIKEIIISDNNGNDLIKEQIKNSLIVPEMKYVGTYKSDKESLIKAIEESRTNNIIILEQELYTRFHQIRKQIKKLRKTDLLLPNRLHKNSLCKYENKKEELRIRTQNLVIRNITKLPYPDLTNINKALKKDKILPLLKESMNKEYYWQETIKKARELGLRISTCETHYKQPITKKDDKTIKRIIELIRIRIKK